MDAYDDFDPQQYDYGDSDEDIVYLEGDQHVAFLPHHQPQAFSQSSPSALKDHQPSPSKIPLNLLPRHERKRRRRMEAAASAARGDDDESSYDSSDNVGPREKEEASEPGAFASLQELLQKAAESPARASQEPQQAMELEDLQQEQQESQAEIQIPGPPPPESQPEFPQPDDELDWPQVSQQQQQQRGTTSEATSYEMHNFHPPTMMPAPRSRPWEELAEPSESLERELKRQRSHQKKKSTTQFSDLGAPAHNSRLLSELEKNRKLAAKGSERKHTAAPRAKKTRQLPRRQQQQPSLSQPVQSEASSISIVGSRPQHWGSRPGGFLSKPAVASAKPRTRKKGKLQRAINANPMQSKMGRALQSALNSKTLFSSLRGQTEKRAAPQTSPRTSEENAGQGSDLDLANASFAPCFRSEKRRQTETDEVQDTAASQPPTHLCQRTPLPRSMFSPTQPTNSNGSAPSSHRRTKKLKAGPLMKRLRAIRGSLQDDKVRFQSGMYPFPRSGISLDRNDPRRRASRYMDVTIVGNPIPWEKEQAHVTALGYVHAISPTSVKKHDSTIDKIDPFFSWISFTFETAREKNLQRNMQLRIYDAICVSLRGNNDDLCNQIVVCTQLCEPYPSVLPALETPPDSSFQEDARHED